MSSNPYGRDSINLNMSGFNDDSMISEIDDDKDNSNFLLKSNTNSQSLLDRAISQSSVNKNNINEDFGIINSNNKLNNTKTYNEAMFEDFFSNTYVIPIDRPHKFSLSKMGHQFIYDSNSKVTSYKIDSKKFGFSKNSQIITYLLSLFIFSEFLNLEELEKDTRFKVIFIKRNLQQKQFIIEDVNSLLNNLEIPNDRTNDFEMFINGINNFLSDNDYLNIQKKTNKKLCLIYLTIIIFIIVSLAFIAGIYYNFKQDEKNILIIVLEFIGLLLIIIGLINRIINAKNIKLLYLFYELRYLLLNYNRVCDYFETWNKNLFENYKIRATTPISLNYIMFNLNPYQDIEIKHIDMNWMKKKFYKSQNELFKNEKELIYFNNIKQNLNNLKDQKAFSIN